MDNMNNSINKQLEVLLLSFIAFSDDLKNNGIISEEEYIKHTIIKKKFLSNINETKML